jgi:hypothetical protein
MKPAEITAIMIAACGMNCAICMGHLREKNVCPGCRKMGKGGAKSCRACIIRKCLNLKGKFCYSCEVFPCRRLKNLDKRYRMKYGMSMLENLEYIKKSGIKKFTAKEQKRWKCPECGSLLSCHRQECFSCGYKVKTAVN